VPKNWHAAISFLLSDHNCPGLLIVVEFASSELGANSLAILMQVLAERTLRRILLSRPSLTSQTSVHAAPNKERRKRISLR